MGTSRICEVAVATSVFAMLIAPSAAVAKSIEFGKTEHVPIRCQTSLVEKYGSSSEHFIHANVDYTNIYVADVDEEDVSRNSGSARATAVGFGTTSVGVRWAVEVYNKKTLSYDEVDSESFDDIAEISCTKASIPRKKCDRVFDRVAYTTKSLCRQRDSEMRPKLSKALNGYRFVNGDGYKVSDGGKSVVFTRGGKNVPVKLKRGKTLVTVMVGTVHSQDGLYKAMTGKLKKGAVVTGRKFSKKDGTLTVAVKSPYHGTTISVVAWSWYQDGKRYSMLIPA